MTLTRFLILGIGTLCVVFFAACTPLQKSGIPAQQLSVPPGNYRIRTILRFPDGEIWLPVGEELSYESQMARYYSVQEEQIIDIPLPADPRCERTKYTAPTALPDGKLGFSMICGSYWSDRPIGQDDALFIMAYDRETGIFEQIVEEPLSLEASSSSWNPDMTRGVLGIGTLLGTIAWVTPIGMEPMRVTIGTGKQSWSLAESLVVIDDYSLGNDRTTEVGIARNPAWSPDGRFIAFWASTNVIGRDGMARARGTYSLYLLDPDTLHLQQILENVQNMTILVWSPNSQWLAFTGDIGSAKNGLWLISADGNRLQFVDKGAGFDFYSTFNGWNWLNNEEIIATRCLDSNCDQTEVIEYDASGIVNPVQE